MKNRKHFTVDGEKYNVDELYKAFNPRLLVISAYREQVNRKLDPSIEYTKEDLLQILSYKSNKGPKLKQVIKDETITQQLDILNLLMFHKGKTYSEVEQILAKDLKDRSKNIEKMMNFTINSSKHINRLKDKTTISQAHTH